MNTLRENQRVSYELEQDRRGKMAAVNLSDASDTVPVDTSDEQQPAANDQAE